MGALALLRRCGVLALLLVLVGCVGPEQPPAMQPLEFVANDGQYAAYSGETFGMNLLFVHLRSENLEQASITGIELQPQTDIVKLNRFRVFSLAVGNVQARKALSLEWTAQNAGTHTFTDATITTKTGSYSVPLGSLRVEVRAGPAAQVQALFQSKGVIVTPGPGSFIVVNPSADLVVLKQIVPLHSSLGFGDNGISVDVNGTAQPFPAGGLELPPQARITITLDWKLDMPKDTPLNLEWRPILVIDRQGSEQFVGMANLIFRNAPTSATLN